MVMMALAISLTLSWIFGVFFRMTVRFAAGIGYNFRIIKLLPEQSRHDLLYLCAGLYVLAPPVVRALLFALACAIAWSGLPRRALARWTCWAAAHRDDRLPQRPTAVAKRRKTLYQHLQRLYRLFFSLPIRKGWVRE